jgi:hypothetical protein
MWNSQLRHKIFHQLLIYYVKFTALSQNIPPTVNLFFSWGIISEAIYKLYIYIYIQFITFPRIFEKYVGTEIGLKFWRICQNLKLTY